MPKEGKVISIILFIKNQYLYLSENTDILIETLQVFINQILYLRNIFPERMFNKRRFLNLIVYISTYPSLNSYIGEVLKTARFLLRSKDQNNLRSLDLLIYSGVNNLIESYSFDINKRINAVNNKYLTETEEQIRMGLSKLKKRFNLLPDLKENIRFKLAFRCTQDSLVKLLHDSHYQVGKNFSTW